MRWHCHLQYFFPTKPIFQPAENKKILIFQTRRNGGMTNHTYVVETHGQLVLHHHVNSTVLQLKIDKKVSTAENAEQLHAIRVCTKEFMLRFCTCTLRGNHIILCQEST
jgi:hypothetical protein